MSSGKLEIGLNVNLSDGNYETPLSLSLWTDQFGVASQLLKQGADIECLDMEESGLLYVSIMREKADAALFLLDNGADFKKRYMCSCTLYVIKYCIIEFWNIFTCDFLGYLQLQLYTVYIATTGINRIQHMIQFNVRNCYELS
jgi:ankyrin repeat protein